MSYSRWSNSRFYTMWSAKTTSTKRDDQIFEIIEFGEGLMFTYKEIKNDIDKVIEHTTKYYSEPQPIKLVVKGEIISDENNTEPNPLAQADMYELKAYLLRFLEDVENDKELVN